MRSKAVLCSFALITILFTYCGISDSRAQSLDAFLNAPGWDLAYDVEFKSSDSGTYTSLHGPISYKRSVVISSSQTFTLGMRNMGSTLGMLRATMGGDMQSEAAQQAMIDLSMRAESMANWISSGPSPDENASDADQMAAVMAYMESSKGPGRLEYTMKERGVGLVEESGSAYDLTRTTTTKGTGTVIGPTTLTFEIDAESKTYLLTLGYTFGDKSDSTVLTEVVSETSWKSGSPETTREVSRSPLGRVPGQLRLDDPKSMLGDTPLIQGEVDPSKSTISGERTIKGYYESGGAHVPGTFDFRYKLTPKS